VNDTLFALSILIGIVMLPWCVLLMWVACEIFRVRDRLHKLEGRDCDLCAFIEDTNKRISAVENNAHP
jgi:hypothetical protein